MTNQHTEDQSNIIKSCTLRYVSHNEVKKYQEKGWRVVSDFAGSHHARYSVIMQKDD
jgi:hypothetical protein